LKEFGIDKSMEISFNESDKSFFDCSFEDINKTFKLIISDSNWVHTRPVAKQYNNCRYLKLKLDEWYNIFAVKI